MTQEPASPLGPVRRPRIASIGLARGLIMVIMALDHSHDFFGNFAVSPTDLATTTAGLFLTRWVTHICAPTFFLLTGTGAYLTVGRMSKGELARYLVSRGLWLIFLELVIMGFALQLNLDYQVTIITVLWALGWAMIILAGLIWLPLWSISIFGVVLVLGHDALDGVRAASLGAFAAEDSLVDAAVVPEHQQVPAVAAIPDDDAGPRAPPAPRVRRGSPPVLRPAHTIGKVSLYLLRAALLSHSPPRGGAELGTLRDGTGGETRRYRSCMGSGCWCWSCSTRHAGGMPACGSVGTPGG